jgi:hypothetical protein
MILIGSPSGTIVTHAEGEIVVQRWTRRVRSGTGWLRSGVCALAGSGESATTSAINA